MTKDRLAEFRVAANLHGITIPLDSENDPSETTSLKNDSISRIGTGLGLKSKNVYIDMDEHPLPPDLSEFFKQVTEVRKKNKNLRSKVDDVEQKHTAMMLTIISSSSTDNQTKELIANLDQAMADIRKLSQEIRTMIKLLEAATAEKTSLVENGAEWRMRKSQHRALVNEFEEIMNRYNQCQVDYREKCMERIRRGLKITGNTMTTEEIEEGLDSGDTSVFTQGVLIQTAQAKQSLRDIEARHTDIIKVENSIRELRDMFYEIAALVQTQGEQIDLIEYNVQHAVDYIEEAKQQLTEADRKRNAARRKKIKIIICVSVAVLILILIIALSVALS